MRLTALALFFAACTANAASLEVSVTQADSAPEKFSYHLNGSKQVLDLRESKTFNAAFKDKAGRDLCRPGLYRTGMIMTMQDVEKVSDNDYKIEIVGQVTTLNGMKSGTKLSCGTNEEPQLNSRAFSDTTVLTVDRTKALVIDKSTTLLITLKD